MIRIGLISDTHETDQPLTLVEQLRGLGCDYYVHLGDIGGSRTSAHLVREYKGNPSILEHLSPEKRAQYEMAVRNGVRGVIAWLQVAVDDDPEGARLRRQETADSYDEVVAAMQSLPNAVFLAGNVEHIAGRGEIVRRMVAKYGVDFVESPQARWLDGAAMVLWPSPAKREQDLPSMLRLADELRERVVGHAPVLILTHEQMFKGPMPAVYRAGVEATGRLAGSIPYYEPNAQRLAMLRFLRSLPPEVVCGVVHGHIHDPNEAILAGAPYLGPLGSRGLRLRLYGLDGPCRGSGWRGAGRRTAGSFCVPAGRLAVLTVEGVDYRVEMLPPP